MRVGHLAPGPEPQPTNPTQTIRNPTNSSSLQLGQLYSELTYLNESTSPTAAVCSLVEGDFGRGGRGIGSNRVEARNAEPTLHTTRDNHSGLIVKREVDQCEGRIEHSITRHSRTPGKTVSSRAGLSWFGLAWDPDRVAVSPRRHRPGPARPLEPRSWARPPRHAHH